MAKKYFGRKDPRPEDQIRTRQPGEESWDRIFSRATATDELALEILGLDWQCSEHEGKTAYRHLATKNHPDRGGSTKMFQWIEAAWSLLKTHRGW